MASNLKTISSGAPADMTPPRFDALWKALKLDNCTVVDIGARGDADPRWRNLGGRLALIGFEPDRDECARLNASAAGKRTTFLPDALYDLSQKIKLHLCRSGGTSSCYRPNLALLKRFPHVERFDIIKELSLDARTLDEALAGREPLDFVKIDTQGAELKIVQGGRARIGEAFGLEVEVEFSPIYEGQPLFGEVDAALREMGFVLFDLRPCYWKRTERPTRGTGQLIFADALYFKDPIATGILPRDPAAALAVCVLYGKFDYASELAGFFANQGVYTREEHARIDRALRNISAPRASLGRMRGALRAANILQSLADRFRDPEWSRYEMWRF
jgi:FkbM family methyltransferase